jgi:hypothetical protein
MWNWKQFLFAFVIALSLVNQALTWAPAFQQKEEEYPLKQPVSNGKVLVASSRFKEKTAADKAIEAKSPFPKQRGLPC